MLTIQSFIAFWKAYKVYPLKLVDINRVLRKLFLWQISFLISTFGFSPERFSNMFLLNFWPIMLFSSNQSDTKNRCKLKYRKKIKLVFGSGEKVLYLEVKMSKILFMILIWIEFFSQSTTTIFWNLNFDSHLSLPQICMTCKARRKIQKSGGVGQHVHPGITNRLHW